MTSGSRVNLLLSIVFILAASVPAAPQTCRPGLPAAGCAGTNSAWDNRTRPLTRDDINARIGPPGAPISRDVTADTARSWEAVRRQPRPPAIASPSDPTEAERKGDRP
jgi:hypothetical protein